jgi:PAS domain S-box-containing protein
MDTERDELTIIKKTLGERPNGMTVTDISKTINMSRNSVAKYLEMLTVSGQVDMKMFGPSKVFYPSQRVPISTMLGLSSDLIVTLDRDLKIRQANARFLKLVGMTLKRVENKPIAGARIPILSDAEFAGHLKDALDGKEFAREICVKKGRSDLYFNAKLIPTAFDDGNRGVTVIMEDITARKQAELELKQAHDSLEQKVVERTAELAVAYDRINNIVESISDVFMSFDTDWHFTYVNVEAEKFFGKKRDELIGNVLWNIYPDSQLLVIYDKYRQAMSDGVAIRSEEQLPQTDMWYDLSAYPFKGGLSVYIKDINQRKQVEAALEEARTLNRAILDSLSSHIAVLDSKGNIFDVNNAWNRFALDNGQGSTAGVGQGINYFEVCEKAAGNGMAQAQTVLDGLRSVLAGATPVFEQEYSCDSPDEKRWFIMRATLLSGNAESGLVIAHINITERKLAEEIVASARDYYHRMFDTLPSYVWQTDRDGKCSYVNRSWQEFTGRALEQERGDAWLEGVHPADRDAFVKAYMYAITARVPFELVYRLRNSENEYRWMVSFGRPFDDLDGQFAGYLGSCYDITERKRAEDLLRDSEEKYRSLFNTMSEGFALHEIICDADGKPVDYVFLDMNPAFEHQTGLKKVELIDRKVSEALPGTEPFWIETYGKVALTGEPARFENYTRVPGKWYEVYAFSPTRGRFAVVFTDITERKRAEEALRVSLEKLEFAEKATKIGFWDWDMATGKLTWSPEFFELFGLTPDAEPTFDMLLSVIHQDDRDAAMAKTNRAVEERIRLENEYRIIMPDGQVRWISAIGDNFYDAAGRPVRMSGICINVTERKLAEEILLRTQFLVDKAADMVFWLTPDARILYANEAVSRILGYSREELQAMRVFDINREHDEGNWQEHWEELKRRGSITFENEVKAKDGRLVPVDISANYARFGDDDYNYSFIRDISERKRVDEELRENEERFRRIFDESPLGMIITSMDYRYLQVNDQMTLITGYSKEELLGSSYEQITHPDDRAMTAANARKLLDGTAEHVYYEKRYVQKGSSVIWVQVSLGVVKDAAGKPQYFVGTVEDITERKLIEEALKASEERGRRLLEQSFDAVYIQTDGFIVYANDAAIMLLGGEKPGDLLGKPFLDFVAPEYREMVKERASKVTAGAIAPVIEEKYIRLDGSILDLEVMAIVENYQGRLSVRVTFRDISVRKQIEEALRDSEARYRELFNSAQEGFLLIGVDADGHLGTVLEANDLVCHLTGFSRDELVNRTIWDIFAPDDAGDRPEVSSRLIKGEPAFMGIEIIAKDRRRVPLEISLHVFTIMGEATCLAIARDMSERQQMSLELERSLSILNATLDSTTDGIMVTDPDGHIIRTNKKMDRIWEFPEEVLRAGDRDEGLKAAYLKVIDQDKFIRNTKIIESRPEKESFDVIAFRNGRVFDRYSQPLYIGARVAGRVWSFRDVTERRKTEEELVESERKFRNVVEESTEGMIIVDEEGRIIEYNRAAAEIFGYEDAHVVGRLFWDFIFMTMVDERKTGLAYDMIKKNIRHYLSTGIDPSPKKNRETEIARPDGTRRIIQTTNFTIPTARGLMIVTIATDITERKQAEEVLRGNLYNFQTMADQAAEGMIWADADGQVVFWNRAASQIFGYSREEIVGKPLSLLFHEPGIDQQWLLLTQKARAGEISDALTAGVEGRRKDGNAVPLEVSMSGFRSRDELFFTVIARDITARKNAEKAVRESESLLRDTVKNVSLLSVTLDTEGHVTCCNNFFLKATGWNESEVAGQNWFETFIPPEEAGAARSLIADIINSVDMGRDICYAILARDGRRLKVSWHHTQLKDINGRTTGIACLGEISDK